MSDVAIRAENLSKAYRISRSQGAYRYRTLQEEIIGLVRRPFQRATRRDGRETIWALKDVSFEIKQGEVLGIVGRNGAGKSTLLKILSRITEPTTGYADVYGRVGSLLEVGTGFHPELTGRENTFLNGAILGMTRAEIRARFEEIVAFAEVEKFIDTPVKYFSSGMYVRLAFAVAAHLQPEILLVDEVLAVGDVEFQKKCIGKMEKIADEGRTVVVVSHSMSTVKALCSRAMLLDRGAVKAVGPVDDVVAKYLSASQADAAEKVVGEEDHLTGVKQIRVKRIRLLNGATNSFAVYWQQPISIAIDVEVLDRVEDVAFGAGIRTIGGAHVLTVHQDDDGSQPLWTFEPGEYTVKFTLQNDLRPGLYKLHVGADIGHIMIKNLLALDAVTLEVLDHSQQGSVPEASNTGLVNGRSAWKCYRLPETEQTFMSACSHTGLTGRRPD